MYLAMKNNPLHRSMEYEFLSPFWMVGCLLLISSFDGQDSYTHKGMIIYTTQAHAFIVHLMWLVFWVYMYLQAWGKICHKTYRILSCAVVFMILMLLGYYFVPWWKVRMAIPLTILWYPIHRQILKGLPRKEINNSDIPSQNP